MVIVKKGDCEHCGRLYRYSLWHSGFGDNSYAYCDDCGMLALLNYSNPSRSWIPAPVHSVCRDRRFVGVLSSALRVWWTLPQRRRTALSPLQRNALAHARRHPY